MAVAPLFLTMAALRARLRLSAISTTADVEAILEDAVVQVRVGTYAQLGTQRVAELVALASVENPTSENGVFRAIAEVMEATWVRVILLDRLPLLWGDQSGAEQEVYNAEGTFRSLDAVGNRQMRERLQRQVDEWLAILAGSVSLGDAPPPNIWSSDKPVPTPVPGESPFIKQPLGDGQDFMPGDFDGNFIDRIIDGDAP